MTIVYELNGDEEMTEWSEWGPCDRLCGDGTAWRFRFCLIVDPVTYEPLCDADEEEFKACRGTYCHEEGEELFFIT